MKRKLILLLYIGSVLLAFAQQISIPRIDLMHNMPVPYVMRDWKQVALNYDNLVFNTSLTGTYLPLTAISTDNGINYPALKTIRMDSYVGQTDHGRVAEAINIIPAVVGASLVGVDKSAQLNTNWAVKVKDFFNLQNRENVYLNNYSTSTGSDWWYEIMPNIYFYQLYSIYPTIDADFPTQFTTIANREFGVLNKLGGTIQPWNPPDMNYRAFNLITGTPNATSVPEPETAGSIAWIMYQAYIQTGNFKYLEGAELGLDFLQNWTGNPSYEVQLPYGIETAARMNAVEGTNYDIQKMMNWTFSSGSGTLRGWGTIVGNWNGYDVSGLIGEANDAGDDYAFCMNGFQHASALAPVAKYDKRFSRELGKWLLNLANASRLYYRNALPQANQEPASYVWSLQYDAASCIPNESMKQTLNGISPFATGDAVKGGGAATNLALYSGSSVGYLASIIAMTNVDGILQVDLNKTDFRGDKTYPSYLYYNPTTSQQSVQLILPAGNSDVYDAITESLLATNARGVISFSIPSDSTRQLVVYPAGNTPQIKGRLKLVNGHVIDYHTGYNYTNPLRIKAFSVSDTIVQKSNTLNLYCLPENRVTTSPSFQWLQNNQLVATTTVGNYTWTAPSAAGVYQLTCKVSGNGDTVTSAAFPVKVVDIVIPPPVISNITFSAGMPFDLSASVTASAILNTTAVTYSWSSVSGTLTNNLTASPAWTLPGSPGIYTITLSATNASGTASFTKSVLVKDFSIVSEPTPLIYYPFNGDTKNYAQNAYQAVSVGAVSVTGANGVVNGAYDFPSSDAYIYTPNDAALNFQDKIAVSFWVKPDALPNSEQFILSHGSWEERYKVSIIPGNKVRWTVKTNFTTIDLDADTVLQIGKYDHYTAIYTGYSMELYRNGNLSSFKAQNGLIQTTGKSLTIARKDDATTNYNFVGAVDEVRIYDADLSPQLIKLLPGTFKLLASGSDTTTISRFNVFPNPFIDELAFDLPTGEIVGRVMIYDLLGKSVFISNDPSTNIHLTIPNGFYILKISTPGGKLYKAKIIKKN
ncbi:MAG: LamG-like jellyroll fold domain-containing protein [Bacteroidota bacterium]|nr:LamG-like jellyroll fold domain-containing protein [Bacteroidota bacterium]